MPSIHSVKRCARSLPLLLGCAVALANAAPPARLDNGSASDLHQQVMMRGDRIAWVSPANDLGRLPDDAPVAHLSLQLKRSPASQAALDELLRQQQDPGSVNYHAWLTPEQFGARFGAAPEDLQALTDWLQGQGFTVEGTTNNRMSIGFSGVAANVISAFATELHSYSVNGETRIANDRALQLPRAIAERVQAVRGLRTSHAHSYHHQQVQQLPASALGMTGSPQPQLSNCQGSSCTYFLFPADFATIYGIAPVAQTLTGAGQNIAIVGRAQVSNADIEAFENIVQLPKKDPQLIVPTGGVAPPAPKTSCTETDTSKCGKADDQGEATLDVERAVSIAPGASIYLVASSDVGNNDGVFMSLEYAIDHTPLLANIISVSFGDCEGDTGQEGATYFNSLFSAAAAEGISVLVASDDSGAAGCDADNATLTPPATQFRSINAVCASGNVTCVGGTEFADSANPARYWSASNTSNYGSAFGYIPEGAWNEPIDDDTGAPEVAATGGGVSLYVATPSWQVGPGVPGNQGRYVPDVSFSAAQHDGYFTCIAESNASCVISNGSFGFLSSSGTSAAAPSMAGIVALLNQQMGGAQGNLNRRLYALAAASASGVFHDVTVASSGVIGCTVAIPSLCNNSTAGPAGLSGGQPGYLVGTGYDEATGLGSIDVQHLLAQWSEATPAAPLAPIRRCRIAPLHC